MRFSLLAVLIACAVLAQNGSQYADLVIRNGRIVTMNAKAPFAQAVAVRGDRILAVGTNAEIARYTGRATKVIDLRGMMAMPGFIEGHGHFLGLGEFRLGLDLRNARTWDDVVAQVAKAASAAKPGEWIVGSGWHQSKWDRAPEPNIEGFPRHESLSRVSPNNAVMLSHASGHAVFVNANAMRQAGIGVSTPNPPGGEILKDRQGGPTGLLRETAEQLVSTAYARWREKRPQAEQLAELKRVIDLATDECLSKGITSFSDAGSPLATVDALRSMALNNQLRLRLWVMLSGSNAELESKLAQYRTIGAGNNHLTVRAIKKYMDGALGSRGAWLLKPYSDKAGSVGLNTDSPADIERTAELALGNGYQLCVHAIGDRANRETLDVFERAMRRNPEKKDLRWRVEHAQHLSAADIPRFGALGVIAAMQSIHCTSDAPYVIQRLGEGRAKEGAYVWRKLLDSGAVIANGTDTPVEDVDPLPNFYAAVTRKLKDGGTFFPEQRMTREEALRSYTLANAYATFEENLKGSLEPGKLADITVLSSDILSIPDDQITGAQVEYTIVGGKVAYQRRH
jgi:predicted amidohydrolase YtcJ